ncbi:MAG: hypothetical protein BGO31_02185 [Bacteroidetes bacterium 43-16]|nr:MAG: hypothetical protein BGO31_02185 [Bacteroidetes bacterium 43-16]
MNKANLSVIEQEMINFDFASLKAEVSSCQETMSLKASTKEDVLTKICNIWRKIRTFVKIAEKLPLAGKYIKILADLLDSLCPS